MIIKKGILTRDIVIVGLLFSSIVGLMFIFLVGIAGEYNNTDIVDEGFVDNYNRLTDISSDVNISRATTASGEGLSFLGTFDVVFQSTFTFIRLIFGTLDILGDMASNIVSDFTFLDASVIRLLLNMFLAILTIIIISAWLSSISRGRL